MEDRAELTTSHGDFNETALLFICVAASKAWGHDISPWEGRPGLRGTSRFLSSCLSSDTNPPSLLQSYTLPSCFFSGASESWGEYHLPCTLWHLLKVNRFSLSVGNSTRRRTKVNAVIRNLINTKPQKHTPGLDAFPVTPAPLYRGTIPAGVQEAAMLSSLSGNVLTHISS